jgi:hypothetical protein
MTPTGSSAWYGIRCLSEQCTVIFAGYAYTLTQLDDEISSGSEFGKKLALAKREVMELM